MKYTSIFFVVLGVAIGVFLSQAGYLDSSAQLASDAANKTKSKVMRAAASASGQDLTDIRMQVLLDNPRLLDRISEGGSFGGDNHSRVAAQNMFGKHHQEAIDDVKAKTSIEAVGDRVWLIRMPIVNAALFETDEGLVLVDAGMAPAGPALVEAIKSVSEKPLHTIIFTHGHVDHAFGAWALVNEWNPKIVAHENILPRFKRYMRIPRSLAKYMSQKTSQLPRSAEDIIFPTETFGGNELTLNIGGEAFVLKHYPAETDDQLFVWVPSRSAIVAADYYQGFLPNAGNGKRVQRYVEEWAEALREMVALSPDLLLPMHGEVLEDKDEILANLSDLAAALQHIVDYTLAELDKGTRKDLIFQNAKLPPELTGKHSLRETYVSVKDISKMVLKQYTGWWDDIPSHWTPALFEEVSAAVVQLAGNIEALDSFTRELMQNDLPLASHFADFAFYANPNNALAQQLVIDVYTARMLDERSNTQELLAYLDHLAAAKSYQLKSQ